MDRREALKKIAVGGAVVAGTSMISTSPAFAAAPSPGPNPNLGPITLDDQGRFNIHAGFGPGGTGDPIAPTCNGSPGATWSNRLCWNYYRGNSLNSGSSGCVTELTGSDTISNGNVTPPTPGVSNGDRIEIELIVKVMCPGETPVCYRWTETATASKTGNNPPTWTYTNYTGPTVVLCPVPF